MNSVTINVFIYILLDMGEVIAITRKSLCLFISYVNVISHPKFELRNKAISGLSDILIYNFFWLACILLVSVEPLRCEYLDNI